jgi:hypothetical protein
MKRILQAITVCVALVSTAAAETPDTIIANYRAKASAALETLNTTLEKATVPLIAELVKVGDTSGADILQNQLKAKQSGETVAQPHGKAANLFVLYDAARIRALDPIQKDTIKRLDTILAGVGGKNLATIDAVKKARAEVEVGKTESQSVLAEKWNYHMAADKQSNGTVTFKPDGTLELKIEGRRSVETGTWKQGIRRHHFDLTIGKEQFVMVVDNDKAVMERPIGKRFLTLASDIQ